MLAIDRAAEDALIPLSALQHYLFCPRQCALIHVEQLWAEDAATAEGRILHEKADAGRAESRPGVRIARGVALRSIDLGVAGKADVVEFHGVRAAGPTTDELKDAGGEGCERRPRRGGTPAAGSGTPFPVEYKRGKPKAHRADEVQLCAQAICLEEAFGVAVAEGALFYGETRRRQGVVFDDALRALTAATAAACRAMIAVGTTPAPVSMPACRRCSLEALCQPKRLEKPPSVAGWLARQLEG